MVYVFLADGFEEMEALSPVDILRRAKIEVATVGIAGKRVTGAHGIVVEADLTEAVLDDSLEMVVLPGGMGHELLKASPLVQRAVGFCVGKDVPVAAICAAPSILGELGLLKGVRACCFPGFEEKLEGAIVVKEGVCSDGDFITAKSAGHAANFALRLVEVLRGTEKAREIYNEIYQEEE